MLEYFAAKIAKLIHKSVRRKWIYGLCVVVEMFLDVLGDDIDGNFIASALGNDDVGVPLCGFDEL